ncbi:MAG: lipopolysaccharide biosynthesis protein [Candidatus Omnitrophica bacterium]|nr:lipopolysaccharide biosynthesis protein [Candidatus Omnitrophota bacterium]
MQKDTVGVLCAQESMSRKVVHGGLLLLLLRITGHLFRLLCIIVLARLLSPQDFGFFGIVMLVFYFLETFSKLGFNEALIQKKNDIAPYLNSTWTIQIIKCLFFAALLLIFAPMIAGFFRVKEAAPLIRVLSLSVFLRGIANIGIIYFYKELEFYKQFLFEFVKTSAYLLTAIVLAFFFRNVWALVIGFLAGDLAGLILSYTLHSYRPKFRFDPKKSKELIKFGKWIFASGILAYLLTQMDNIFIGKMLAISMLGFYQIAYRISDISNAEINNIISYVAFPAYSKIQDDIVRLKSVYITILYTTVFLSFPIAALIFVLAGDFTMIFLGKNWMAIVPVMRVLVFYSVMASIISSMTPVFCSIGKPKVVARLQAAQVILLLIFIYPLTRFYGIAGTAAAVVSASAAMFFIRTGILIKAIGSYKWQFYKPIVAAFLTAFLSAAFVFLIKFMLIKHASVYTVILQGVLFCIIFVIFSCVADMFLGNKLLFITREVFNSIKRREYHKTE